MLVAINANRSAFRTTEAISRISYLAASAEGRYAVNRWLGVIFGYNRVVVARRLETEIRKPQLDANNPLMSFVGACFAQKASKKLMVDLKKRLRDLDPNSPYAV